MEKKFSKVHAYGTAGGWSGEMSHHVNLQIWGTGFALVEEVRQLVAAAPAMLAALVEIRKAFEEHADGDLNDIPADMVLDLIKAAICGDGATPFPVPAAPLHLNERELGAVLAGLRTWQAMSDGAPPEIDDIADGGGAFDPLDADEIDELCERINA